ncbi:hypothetical protein M0804_012465 [Polistes exclamans]|nr:hypothetical protein M0804_012465 [Polistes exclamans]
MDCGGMTKDAIRFIFEYGKLLERILEIKVKSPGWTSGTELYANLQYN